MPARGKVGIAPGQEQLTASRGIGRAHAFAHPVKRQEPQQNKMDKRYQQLLHQRSGDLPGHTRNQGRAAPVQKSRQAPDTPGFQPHIRVHPQQQVMLGPIGQHPAGMLLAAPPGRQVRGLLQPNPGIPQGPLAHDRDGSIRGVVIQHHHFQVADARTACQGGLNRLANRPLLIPGRNQHRHPHLGQAVLCLRRGKIGLKVFEEHQKRQHGNQ